MKNTRSENGSNSQQEITRLSIRNIWVDAVDMQGALGAVERFIVEGERVQTVLAANPEKTFSVPADPLLHEMFRQADLLIPDGIGMVLAARLLHGARLERVPGCELMERICALAAAKGTPIFIYGAAEEVNEAAADRLREKYPGLEISGRSHGYRKPEEMDELVEEINRSRAAILFLALGSPRQEQWMAAHREKLTHVRVCQGIGGTLDVVTGRVKRAPEIWCRLGLEWLYRLVSEPRRIKRQKVLPIFVWKVLMDKLGRRSADCGP